jgi:DNA-binding NarL/FixJ family response regulator
MRIVSLEDDEPFWDLLQEALTEAFPGADLVWVRTESEFRQNVKKFAAKPPDIFLLDVMVKWADAAEDMPKPPAEVVKDGYFRAGLRCHKLLLENTITRSVPVVLFTVLERSDVEKVKSELPAGSAFVGKSGDFRELIRTINALTDQPRKISRRRDE